ncbi:MAG: TetR/AcrR family transcriptional regulator, partial [Conexibacter sp.]|nr:TetR/AcrR family transcriptional regulator [Conexibacter sp.]
ADGQAAGAVVAGDPEAVAIVAFAALQGLVALASNGLLDGTPLSELLDGVVERLVLGLRPR